MDIVLEIWDTFIGDRVYSALLPLSLSSTVSLPGLTNAANSSLSLFGASKPFVYEPATQLFRLEPSKYAYLSAWPRNNIYRQFLSFFLIVWYAKSSLTPSCPKAGLLMTRFSFKIGSSALSFTLFPQPSPTSSSGTRRQSSIQSSSKIRSPWRLRRPCDRCLSCLFWPLPSWSPRLGDTPSCTTPSTKSRSRTIASSSFLFLSPSPISASTGFTAACTTRWSTSPSTSPITSGLCLAPSRRMPSTPWMVGRRVFLTMFSRSSFPFRSWPMFFSSALLTYGR